MDVFFLCDERTVRVPSVERVNEKGGIFLQFLFAWGTMGQDGILLRLYLFSKETLVETVFRRNCVDEKMKPFEYNVKSGNRTIIIHSDLMKLTEEERA